eukprot:m.15583 g.15583  ORF g.15583 m.15583 type:complete len:512 (-) comp4936_c0_seq1:37-1572(-)
MARTLTQVLVAALLTVAPRGATSVPRSMNPYQHPAGLPSTRNAGSLPQKHTRPHEGRRKNEYPSPPAPPYQSPVQRALIERVNASAAVAAAAARPRLLSMLAEPAFQAHLELCCPAIASETPDALLALLIAGLKTSELTHNFNANSTGQSWGDVNMTDAAALGWLPNLWTVAALGYRPATPMHVEDLAEVEVMGFPPFGGGAVGNTTPRTVAEASQRPIYTTVDLMHLSTGNPTFGDVAMIFRPGYVQPQSLLEPVDTGAWEGWCNHTSKGPVQCLDYPWAVNCSAWSPRVQGTFNHPEHILLANILMWDGGDCINATGDMLPRLFSVLFGERRKDMALTHPTQMMTFVEANLAGAVAYPDGVKAVVGVVQSLFGTALGQQLQAWCSHWGWPLLWALAPPGEVPMWWPPGQPMLLDTRVIDPTINIPLNFTIPPTSTANFTSTWDSVATARRSQAPVNWTSTWSALPANLVVSAGLRPFQCGDLDHCVAVWPDGDCFCSKSVESRLPDWSR